jgi:hypothetical protein
VKKQKKLSKIFVPLLVVLIASSFFGTISTLVTGQTTATQDNTLIPTPKQESSTQPLDTSQTAAVQDKAMNFIKNVMSVDLSKYAIELENSDIMAGVPLANDNRKITTLRYALTPLEASYEKDIISISFIFEKDVLRYYYTLPLAEVVTNMQYVDRNAALKGFLENYQIYTNIDSTNLITMLDDVDLTQNSIVTKENIRLVVLGTDLSWTYTVNGLDYTKLEIGVIGGFVRSVRDTRGLYTIGDTSVNISMEQAVDIAMKNLSTYSYKMPDGSIVHNFKTNRDATMPKLVVGPFDYVLRPYWDIRIYLDEVYPGNVFSITAFIWANTGEVISYSNMATGGTSDIDDINVSGTGSTSSSPDNTSAIVVVAVVAVAVVTLAMGLVAKKSHR